MNDPIEWRNSWIQRAGGLASASDTPGPDGERERKGEVVRLLRCVHEGTRLRRVLHEMALDPLHPRDAEVDDLLERLRDLATTRLAELPQQRPVIDQKLSELTIRRLRSDQSYLTQLLTRPDLEPIRRAALLDRFHRDLTWLSELVALVEGSVPIHPAVSARLELDRLEDVLRGDAAPGLETSLQTLRERGVRLRWSLLDGRIAAMLDSDVPEESGPSELWARRFLLSRLQSEVEGLPIDDPEADDDDSPGDPGPRRHLRALIDRRRELAEAASDRINAQPIEERSAAWDELLTAAREESNEILSQLEEVGSAQGGRLLEHSREDMLRLRDDCVSSASESAGRGMDRPTLNHLRRLARRFGRMARIARNEWQEKNLTARLERRFGPRFPKRLDALILLLILLLTALIVAETVIANAGAMTERMEAFFAWSDLAVCSVLLAEFLLKLSFATGKLRYFARHFIIDFVPSIPFGFLAYALAGPSQIVSVQLIRALRIPRLIRYIRLLRPLIRFLRLFIFFFKFTDRLIRRYAYIFNKNIILFELKDGREEESRNHHLLFLLRRHYERRSAEHFVELSPEDRVALAEIGMDDLEARVAEIPAADWSERVQDEDRDIPIEEVVERLIELTPEELLEQMGSSFVQTIDRYLQLFDVPIVRRLPVIRIVLEHRKKGPAEAAALGANLLGHAMQRALDVIYYVADLQATVSPPLFLDKLGRTIVSATRRPAIRLFTFGLTFGALYALVYLIVPSGSAESIEAAGRDVGLVQGFGLRLRSILGWFADKLGLPVIVIGVVCFVLMQLGGWFRRIANQAAEFCERIVEAQFSAQTKMLKQDRRDRDLKFLAERVTLPEIRLRTSDDLDFDEPPSELVAPGLIDGDSSALVDVRAHGVDGSLKESETDFLYTLKLLYQDYLDGSPFHRNDTKASTQLLGNLALRNLSLSNLPYFIRGRKRLDRLDMSRSSSVLGGPYLWFDYITRMIVQETAKLLIDYNRHAVPLERLASSPEEVRARYVRWLSTRLNVPEETIPLPEPKGRIPTADRLSPSRSRPEADEFFETVDFTAVDFLIADPKRDDEIQRRYGDEVAELLRRDRQRNLRGAFRSLPLHRAPISQRTINLFHLYESFLANGRLIILPIRLTWWGIRGVGTMVARVVRVIREILKPRVSTVPEEPGESYQAAVRKIHRMRKPAFIESLWMRARFDVEYLGLPLPSVPMSVGSDSLMEVDLDFIGATRHERIMADRFRDRQRALVLRLSRLMHEFHWNFDHLPELLERDLPHLADRRAEVIRAIVTAWVADHDDVATLGLSIQAMRSIVSHAADPNRDPKQLPDDLPEPPDFGEPLWYRARDVRRPIEDVLELPIFPRLDDDQTRARVVSYLKRHRRVIRGWVRILRGQGGLDPLATLRSRLAEVMLRTDLWSDQILTLRAVQTLTMLDVQHYTELVWNLGGFEHLSPLPPAAELPFTDPEEAEEVVAG